MNERAHVTIMSGRDEQPCAKCGVAHREGFARALVDQRLFSGARAIAAAEPRKIRESLSDYSNIKSPFCSDRRTVFVDCCIHCSAAVADHTKLTWFMSCSLGPTKGFMLYCPSCVDALAAEALCGFATMLLPRVLPLLAQCPLNPEDSVLFLLPRELVLLIADAYIRCMLGQ